MLKLSRTGPIAPTALARGPHPEAALNVLPPLAQWSLRGGEAAADLAGRALGLELPRTACQSSSGDNRHALWLGPDEWLLLSPDAEPLNAALASVPHSLVSVSHRQIWISVSGPSAAFLLNAGCPLDLGLNAFPVGTCTRTVLGKVGIILWRVGAQEFRLAVWRSMSNYLWDFLIQAREQG
jgi:sarcosine oxidase subunit gamma